MDALESLRSIRRSLPPVCPQNASLREELLAEARSLSLDLERPDNVIERVCFQLVETAVVYSAIKLGLLKSLNKNENSTVEDLAKSCNADATLVGRLLRCLASWGSVKQTGPNSYSPTTASYAFAEVKNEAAMEFCFDMLSQGWLALPSFLGRTEWKNPESPIYHPLAQAFNQPNGATFWDLLKDHSTLPAFNIYMSNFNEGHCEWYDFYPVPERLGQDADKDPSSVMMVDIGGGFGHQAINMKRKFPQLPGRYVVQDLSIGLPKNREGEVEFMEHDFFTPQPITGARFYYLRYITHDWTQDDNVKICSLLRQAMKPGYSRLLINDFVVPEVGASRLMTAQDINLLCSNGSMERTLPMHQEYLERAGLKITKVYSAADKISESVIEAQIA